MAVIPAGTFLMGSLSADTERDFAAVRPTPEGIMSKWLSLGFTEAAMATKFMAREHPQHSVTIPRSFALGKFPVTTGEFAAFIQETKRRTAACFIQFRKGADYSGAGWQHPGFASTDRDPVVCVNWYDAQAYVQWLNKKVAGGTTKDVQGPYRLPSEAEWEYAARAGTRSARWWGDAVGVNNAKCDGCQAPCVQVDLPNVPHTYAPPPCAADKRRTSPVGSFPGNPFGLYDLPGNVWQLTDDCWNETYEGAPTDGGPWVSGNCNRRPIRGGGWVNAPWVLRSATRTDATINSAVNSSGFRVAKTLQ
jgi:formylglycine-generating enzyme required for sulfatase activity